MSGVNLEELADVVNQNYKYTEINPSSEQSEPNIENLINQQNEQAGNVVDIANATHEDAVKYLMEQGLTREKALEILGNEHEELMELDKTLDNLRSEGEIGEMSVEIRLSAEEYFDRKQKDREPTVNTYYETIWRIAGTNVNGLSAFGIEASCFAAAIINDLNPEMSLEDQAKIMDRAVNFISRMRNPDKPTVEYYAGNEKDEMMSKLAKKFEEVGLLEEQTSDDNEGFDLEESEPVAQESLSVFERYFDQKSKLKIDDQNNKEIKEENLKENKQETNESFLSTQDSGNGTVKSANGSINDAEKSNDNTDPNLAAIQNLNEQSESSKTSNESVDNPKSSKDLKVPNVEAVEFSNN